MAVEFETILGRLEIAVLVHDATTRVVYANPAACRLLGQPLNALELTPSPNWECVDESEEPVPLERRPHALAQREKTSVRGVVLGIHRGDERVWVEATAEPAFSANGDVDYVVVSFRNIDDERRARRAARQELDRSREQLKLVMDSFPGVLYEFRGAAGKYRFGFLSGRAEEFFGELAQVALSDATPVLATLHPDEQAAFMRSVLESEQNLTPWQFEMRVPQPDGTWRWAQAQSIPRRQGDETVWHGVLTDITEQRRLAETLRHRQRIEAMGELVAGVAHNFNNMLAVVLPNLDMALEETRGDTQLMLREARQATQNAAELVRQLMRIARSEPDAPPESVDLVTVVRDVGALLRRTLGSSMRLDIELPEMPLRVRGVASDLNMVLLNLCFNARDAMQNRIGAELGIRLSQSEQELVLEVRDNGMGMTDATLQRLGQPFFTTKQPGAGTGLGLATVYGLVRALGGHVDVESRLGQGSTFRVCLPRGAAQSVPPPTPDPKPKRLDGLRVLVIEDEAFVREAIRRLLLSVGAEVEVAADGDGGLARLATARADAVLLDLNMPGTPGLQVLAELRARAPELPVVVLTGHASDSPALSAANTVLVKPVLRAALVDAILGAYGKRPPPAGRASA